MKDRPVHAVCSWVQHVTDPWVGKEWCWWGIFEYRALPWRFVRASSFVSPGNLFTVRATRFAFLSRAW